MPFLKHIFDKSILERIIKFFFDSKLTRDIHKDKGSNKYSQTKVSAMIIVFMIVIMDLIAIRIMLDNETIDHVVILENIAFAATLLGFKNYRKQMKIEDIDNDDKSSNKEKDNSSTNTSKKSEDIPFEPMM